MEQVPGVGECRHESAILQLGVPADVVGVQVGAQHVVDLIGNHARRGQARRVVAAHPVPRRDDAAVAVVADAGVHQDGVMRRADHERVNTDSSPVAGGREVGHQPVAIRLERRVGYPRAEESRTHRPDHLLDAGNFRLPDLSQNQVTLLAADRRPTRRRA